ncbi:MAG: arginyltransferase [Myxococcales bacterium]|nr:arginyltransferase [Myxococcales bacterium]
MARLIERIVEEPRPCSYLDGVTAQLEHLVLLDVDAVELEAMLERGWRRFGPDYFRPACPSCSQCLPTRIVAADLEPSRSQRRAKNRSARFEVAVGPPKVDAERLALYARWHADRERTRDWPVSSLDARTYALQFAFPHPAAREVTYTDVDTGRLVGVGLCDETPRAWSAAYFFYDPDYARCSLGIANVLTVCDIAAQAGKPHVYLGFHVAACASLRYKGAFEPSEVLVGWPAFDERPRWVAPGAAAAGR